MDLCLTPILLISNFSCYTPFVLNNFTSPKHNADTDMVCLNTTNVHLKIGEDQKLTWSFMDFSRLALFPPHESSSSSTTTHDCLSSIPSTSPPTVGVFLPPQSCFLLAPYRCAQRSMKQTSTHTRRQLSHSPLFIKDSTGHFKNIRSYLFIFWFLTRSHCPLTMMASDHTWMS